MNSRLSVSRSLGSGRLRDRDGGVLVPLLLVSVLLPLLVIGCVLWSCFTLSRDTRALRDGVIAAVGGSWDGKVQVSAGPIVLGLVRACAGLIDGLPAEAKPCLEAVRTAEVAVLERLDSGRTARGNALSRADAIMTRRGWDRIVGVQDHGDTVALYVPATIRTPAQVKVCVLVLSKRELVLVSGLADLEPLLQLVNSANADRWGVLLRGGSPEAARGSR
jgi:hypothetical protein